jgi:DNA-binding HxlR family transcriptional regulator
VRTYAQYCPIARASEVLGDRWTLLIARDMLVGARRFNDLARGLPGLSRSLLSRRLRQMEVTGLVRRTDDGYELTEAGEELRAVVFGLAEWGARHAFDRPRPEELDPEVLMWWIHGHVDTTGVDRRAVVQVDMSDVRRSFWLVVEPGDASVCYTDPGFDVDASLSIDCGTLYEVWTGRSELLAVVRQGDAAVQGARWVVAALPRWLQNSPAAPYVRAAREDEAGRAGDGRDDDAERSGATAGPPTLV